MTKTLGFAGLSILATLVVGCTSTRISDTLDGIGKMSGRVRTERKYHIERMLRKGLICDGARLGSDTSASAEEIDKLERMAPEVFDRNGISCSVVVESDYDAGHSGLDFAWYMLCGCTFCALPSKQGGTYVYTYRIRTRRSSREASFVVKRRYETWMSSIGLNYLMPFSQDENTAYCWNPESYEQKGRLAELDGMAFALKSLEQSPGAPRSGRPIGREIGE